MNDLISRNALLDAMPKNDELLSIDVRRIICELPKVDAEPVRRGEWICEIEPNAVTASSREVHVFRCSCCNFTWANTAMLLRYFKHCPHCGAKMDGEHNDIQRF